MIAAECWMLTFSLLNPMAEQYHNPFGIPYLLLTWLALIISNLEEFGHAERSPHNFTQAWQSRVTSMDSKMPAYATASNVHIGTQLMGNESGTNNRKLATVLTSINYGGPFFPLGPICTKSIELALDRLRSDSTWLANYDLAFQLVDDEVHFCYLIYHWFNISTINFFSNVKLIFHGSLIVSQENQIVWR